MLLRLPPYLTFKSEDIVSQINDSEHLNFEFLKCNPSDNNEVILLDKACDPNSNLYSANFQKLDTPYISSEECLSLRINKEQNKMDFLFTQEQLACSNGNWLE